jgi:2-dehydro-3-deoxyphosphogluconate aldolase/(4S)-4-hydroxy-2-oxoglutarate aldolase
MARLVIARFSSERFQELPVVGILRGLSDSCVRPVAEAVREGGLTNLEITMNTPGAPVQIRLAAQVTQGAVNIGAGTVTSLELLNQAVTAGASFIVTPTIIPEVIERCVREGIPVFPGALSPHEIVRALALGARCVKVFPADLYGPAYLRQLKDCLPHVQLMPTGGVDVATLRVYVEAGADAFGVGTPLFRPDRIAREDWAWIREQCRAFRKAYQAAIQRRDDET